MKAKKCKRKAVKSVSARLVTAGFLFGGYSVAQVPAAEPQKEFVPGEPIPVGTADGRGPLSLGLSNHPVGAATVYGGSRPDLFVTAGRHSTPPGLFLLRFVQTDEGDVPVFENPRPVVHPGAGSIPPQGHIFQTPDGTIHGFWLSGRTVLRTRFDPETMAFVNAAPDLSISELPSNPTRIGVVVHNNGSAELLFALTHGGPLRPGPPAPDWRSADYFPFDGRGVWTGGWPQSVLYGASISSLTASTVSNVRQISLTDREALIAFTGVTPLRLEDGGPQGVLAGTRFGLLSYYPNTAHSGLSLAVQQPIVDSAGLSQRHPAVGPSPAAYPSLSRPGTTDFIAGGECGLYYYRFTGQYATDGRPVFDEPREVMQNNAKLYPGSLPVLSVIDWNGNGLNDIISGNSEGKILFFENIGTPGSPSFKPGVQIHAAGEPIHIQQGYKGIQGPGEARWGYSCPTAVDWNGNGLPDIVTSSATQRHKVFMNKGTLGGPVLDRARNLYYQGLDLHGTWRVQPAVARIGNRMAYVMLDDDDEFHLYWRLDDRNVTDGGKLRLTSGKRISANFLHAGGTGRLKIVLTDWDGDGKMDLLVGTPRHGSVPDPVNGLPQSLGLPGAAVLFLRNVGSNEEPVFEFPKLMRFRGNPIFHGQHACSPVPWDNGDPSGPDLLVGDQGGVIYYYPRSELSWDPVVPDAGGLHGYWPLDETDGTGITDAAGTFGTGTFGAGVEPGAAAVVGTGLRITEGGLVELSSTQTQLNRDMTISAFVKAESFLSGAGAASRSGILWGHDNKWGLAVQDGGRVLFLFYDTERKAYDHVLTPDSVRITTGQFYHIAAVRSSWKVTIYIDGVPVHQGAISGTAAANTEPQIGRAHSPERALNGVLDEVGLWNRALNGREIAAIAGLGGLAGVPLNSPEIEAVLDLQASGQTAEAGGVQWVYTSVFPEHPDGQSLTAGMSYIGANGRKYVIFGEEGGAFSGIVSAFELLEEPIVYLNDGFSNGDRTHQDLPTSVRWFGSTANLEVVEKTPGSGDYALKNITDGTQARHAAAYFAPGTAPVTLAVGERIVFSADVTPLTKDPDAGFNVFRMALIESGESRLTADANPNLILKGGYGLFNRPAGNVLHRLYYRPDDVEQPLMSSLNGWIHLYDDLPASGFAMVQNTRYSVVMEVERLADGNVEIAYVVSDGENCFRSVWIDEIHRHYSFDTAALAWGGAFGDGLIENVQIILLRYGPSYEGWIADYGLVDSDADPDFDYDGDGFTNWQEYIARTDPTDPESYFSAESVTREGSLSTISFSSALNRLYELWFTPDLTEEGDLWERIQGPRPGIGETDYMVHEQEEESPAGFYRLRVRLP